RGPPPARAATRPCCPPARPPPRGRRRPSYAQQPRQHGEPDAERHAQALDRARSAHGREDVALDVELAVDVWLPEPDRRGPADETPERAARAAQDRAAALARR